MPKTFFHNINLNFSFPGWHQCQVSKVSESCLVIIFLWGRHWQLKPPLSSFHRPYLGKTWSQPLVNGSRYQHSVCTGLDREKYSTLHTCGTKILPCEEDGVVMVFGVVRVTPLLRVGPPTYLLQAAGWVATLDQAYRLQRWKDQENIYITQTVNQNVIAHLITFF